MSLRILQKGYSLNSTSKEVLFFCTKGGDNMLAIIVLFILAANELLFIDDGKEEK